MCRLSTICLLMIVKERTKFICWFCMNDNLIPPFILRDAGLTVNDKAKIHCTEGTVTEEDHTIQEFNTGLFITLQLRSIFSYFPTRKPNLDDLNDGVEVTITPEGPIWDAYDQTYADNAL